MTIRQTYFYFLISSFLLLGGAGCSSPPTHTTFQSPFRLTSSAFKHNTSIPSRYTCDGDNIHPALSINNVPEGTQSLALIVDDPDAPRGTWLHWTLWHIPPDTTAIPEGTIPPTAIQGNTSFGKPGYGGPCPPSGTHHYRFTLYALRGTLPTDTSTILRTIDPSIVIAQTTLIGTYQRNP